MNTNTTCEKQDRMLTGGMSSTGQGKYCGEQSDKTTLVRADHKSTHISNIHRKEKVMFAYCTIIFSSNKCASDSTLSSLINLGVNK